MCTDFAVGEKRIARISYPRSRVRQTLGFSLPSARSDGAGAARGRAAVPCGFQEGSQTAPRKVPRQLPGSSQAALPGSSQAALRQLSDSSQAATAAPVCDGVPTVSRQCPDGIPTASRRSPGSHERLGPVMCPIPGRTRFPSRSRGSALPPRVRSGYDAEGASLLHSARPLCPRSIVGAAGNGPERSSGAIGSLHNPDFIRCLQ